jgi:hypothetical protein
MITHRGRRHSIAELSSFRRLSPREPEAVAREDQRFLVGGQRRLLHRFDRRHDRLGRAAVGSEQEAIGAEDLGRQRNPSRAAAALAGVEIHAAESLRRHRLARLLCRHLNLLRDGEMALPIIAT